MPKESRWINEKENLINFLKEGKTNKEIGEIYGCNSNSIQKAVKLLNISNYRKPKYINWDDEINNLKKLYLEDNLTQEQIADKYKVDQAVISRILTENKIKKDRKTIYTKICPICKKDFITTDRDQIYCSTICSNSRERLSKIPVKEILLKQLEENDWNYSAVGKINGVSGNAIKKQALVHGIFIPKQKDWSSVVDLDSAQKKIDELEIKTASELNTNYRGLANKIYRLNLSSDIVYPRTEFDSSWEENLFTYICNYSNTLGYNNIYHNIILDKECKYERPLVFDIVIDYGENWSKTVIEVQGITHFKDVYKDKPLSDVIKRDEIKYNYCISNNINILYFTYEPKLLEDYSYPHFVYTNKSLLLEKLKEFSLPGI